VSEQDETPVGGGLDSEVIFDIDEWLTEAKPPQRAVVVYSRGDLLARLEELTKAPEEPGGRLGGSPRRREIAALREEIEKSRRVIYVRGLLHSERQELLVEFKGRPEDPDEDFDTAGYTYAAMARAAVRPTMTPEQARKLHAAVGEAKWAELFNATELAALELIDVPLSRLGSENTEDS
jgi:hypothetical protein